MSGFQATMKSPQLKKAVKAVGSEIVIQSMIMQLANVWDAMFLDGFSEHVSAGGTVQNFFSDENERYGTEYSPVYLTVKRQLLSYKLSIGMCFGGHCGEESEYEFSENFELMGNGPTSIWIH